MAKEDLVNRIVEKVKVGERLSEAEVDWAIKNDRRALLWGSVNEAEANAGKPDYSKMSSVVDSFDHRAYMEKLRRFKNTGKL